MTGLRTPTLLSGDRGLAGRPELLRTVGHVVVAAAEQGWSAARWDHSTRELLVVDAVSGPSRQGRRLRLTRDGHLQQLCPGPVGRPVPVTDALATMAATLPRTDLVLLRPRTGPPNRFRVDVETRTGSVTALFECLPAAERDRP